METIYFESVKELLRTKKELEEKLKIVITIAGKKVSYDGDPINVYEATLVLDAINFGFSAKKALQLKENDIIFRKIHIKDHTRRRNMKEIKARLIGTLGKTKKTIEEITDSDMIIKKNEVGIITPADTIENTSTAIINLIKGSKQSNIYNFLERMNASKNDSTSLGLRDIKKPEPKKKKEILQEE